jgi:glycosyltransferase involved in cell wall biosynthesis
LTNKVLLYSPYSLRYKGGGERWVVEVTKRLRKSSFDVVTTTYSGERGEVEADPTFDEECRRLDALEVRSRRVQPGLLITDPRLFDILTLKARESDIILFNNVFPFQELMVVCVKKRADRPAVSMYQAPIVNPTALTAVYRGLFSSTIGREFDAHHVLNRADYEVLQKRGYVHVYRIPNGVDTSRFRPRLQEKVAEKFVVLFAGRLNYHKGFDLLLDILPQLIRSGTGDIEIWAAGSGPLLQLASQLSVKYPPFHVHGQCTRAQLEKLYSQATIAIFPSRWEGLPLAGIEAISSGLPLVAARIAGFEGICVDGVNGVSVEVQQGALGFLSAVNSLYRAWKEQTSMLERYARASREIAVTYYDWSVVVPQVESELLLASESAT